MIGAVRKWIGEWLAGLGQITLLLREVFISLLRQRPSGRELVHHTYFIGFKSQTVVLITGAFTGMVLCAQTYFQFHKVRMDSATLAVVSVSMSSELGPVLTGLMVAGRVGAALAAELGSMRVTEQIDALRTLATHPVDYLVVPRLAATILAMPILAAESIAVGIGAAYALATGFLGIHPAYAWANMLRYTGPEDPLTGVIKAVVYGGLIGLISCYKGLTCSQGAAGVGQAATEAVVYSCIAILVSNFFLTLFLGKILPNS